MYYILLTIALFFAIKKYNENNKITGKYFYIHGFLLWILVMMFSTSFSMLGWAIVHSEYIEKYFYIQIGIFPDWLNLLMWGLYLIFSLIAMFVIFSFIKRKEKARRRLMSLLPILYFLTVYELIKGFYQAGVYQGQEPILFWLILLCIAIALIPFLSIYYFYNKKNVKDIIFIY